MKKVNEPKNVDEVWQCPRCRQDHCGDCVDKCTVNFDVMDKPEGYGQKPMQWKGLIVCPWCYNQLIDMFNSPSHNDKKEMNEK